MLYVVLQMKFSASILVCAVVVAFFAAEFQTAAAERVSRGMLSAQSPYTSVAHHILYGSLLVSSN
jgi:hypothetical protein